DLVALVEQQLGEVRTVLSRHARDDRGAAGLPGLGAVVTFRAAGLGFLGAHSRSDRGSWRAFATFAAKVPSRATPSTTPTTRRTAAGTPICSGSARSWTAVPV